MKRPARMNALLIMQFLLMLSIAVFGDLSRHVPVFLFLFAAAVCPYLLAVRLGRFNRVPLTVIVLWAVLLRLPMFVAPPSLSDDVWRYIHDGNAQRAGINPYRYAPSDAATGNYRGSEYGRINHPDLPTIYPPLAQLAFRAGALSPRALIVWRLILLAAEIGILLAGAAFVRRRNGNVGNLAIYAWHPLAIIESIGSAHLDSLGIALMVTALALFAGGSQVRTGIGLAASVATKLVAAPLVLLMTRHMKLTVAFVCTLAAVYLPFMLDGTNALGSLSTFAELWESNSSIHALLAPLMGERLYRLVAAAMLMGIVIVLRWKQVAIATAALIYFFALLLLAPVIHPWYLLWLLAVIPLREDPFDAIGLSALIWTITVVLAYLAHQQELIHGIWRVPASALFAQYIPVLLAYIFSITYLRPRARKTAAKI